MANERARGLGYKFVTDDKYLVNPFSPTEGISYEGDGSPVSYGNSGIMSQAPIPAPLQYIPREGGGEGRGPTGNLDDPGAVTADDYGYGTVGDMGMTEEEQKGVNSINNARPSVVDGLRAIGAFTIGGPINAGYSLMKSQERAKEKAIAEAKAAQQQRDRETEVQGIQSRLDSGKTLSDIGRESYTGSGMAFEERDTGTGRGPKKDGGRAGYFFGGRVNYKAGGRINFRGGGMDMGNESNQTQSANMGGGTSGDFSSQEQTDNNDRVTGRGGDTKPTFYSPPNRTETLYENTEVGNVPIGLTRNMNIGRLSAMLNLNKLKDEELEGKMQFDSSIGPVNTTTSYDTITGPAFRANYTNGPVNFGYDSNTGVSGNYSKDIGPGTFTAGVNYGNDGTFQGDVRYGINFANGGLASIL